MKFLLVPLIAALLCTGAVAQPLAEAELDRIHAGFIDPAGQQFSIGAVMKSYVDGSLELTSTLSRSAAGTVTTQVAGANAVLLDTAALARFNAVAAGGGVTIAGQGGATTFIHNFTSDQLTNMVVNSADNRAIVQNTAVTVVVPNLPAIQQAMALQSLGSRLQSAIGLQQLQAGGH